MQLHNIIKVRVSAQLISTVYEFYIITMSYNVIFRLIINVYFIAYNCGCVLLLYLYVRYVLTELTSVFLC